MGRGIFQAATIKTRTEVRPSDDPDHPDFVITDMWVVGLGVYTWRGAKTLATFFLDMFLARIGLLA